MPNKMSEFHSRSKRDSYSESKSDLSAIDNAREKYWNGVTCKFAEEVKYSAMECSLTNEKCENFYGGSKKRQKECGYIPRKKR